MKKLAALVTASVMCFALAGCGSSSQTEAPKDDAKLSGKVVVYMPSPAGLADKLASGFEKKTGVKVEQFQGTTGEILARLEAEKSNPVADVIILASWADGLSLKNKGELQSYAAANADKMNTNWVDKDNMLYGTSASAVGVIYNTNLIPQLNADWNELTDPKYKDQLAIPDPEKSGACKDFLAGFVNANGWETLEGLAAKTA